jgi:hypothetical protein
MVDATEDRIIGNMTTIDAVMILIDGSYGSTKVIGPLLGSLGNDAGGFLLVMDKKRLYGHDIARLFELCGGNINSEEDIERFKYHVCVELPNQQTGEITIYGPYFKDLDVDTEAGREFFLRRQFWYPGSFWGLEHPPSERNYEFPIN